MGSIPIGGATKPQALPVAFFVALFPCRAGASPYSAMGLDSSCCMIFRLYPRSIARFLPIISAIFLAIQAHSALFVMHHVYLKPPGAVNIY